MNVEKLREGYLEWLSWYKWQWFATLTFRGSPSFSKADRIFRLWIDEIRSAVGTGYFSWFRVTERGAFSDNLHFHLLVAGMRDSSKWHWFFRWEELAGEADIAYFISSGGALEYSLKTLRTDADFEVEYEFCDMP